MRIRDSFAVINGDMTEYYMPSGGLEIIADDGRTLFCINSTNDGGIDIGGGIICKHQGKMLDSIISINPVAANRAVIRKRDL